MERIAVEMGYAAVQQEANCVRHLAVVSIVITYKLMTTTAVTAAIRAVPEHTAAAVHAFQAMEETEAMEANALHHWFQSMAAADVLQDLRVCPQAAHQPAATRVRNVTTQVHASLQHSIVPSARLLADHRAVTLLKRVTAVYVFQTFSVPLVLPPAAAAAQI